MANFEIPESPEYISEIRKLETSDPAHADLFNKIFQTILNNLEYLKKYGRVMIGTSDIVLKEGDTLLVVNDTKEADIQKIIHKNLDGSMIEADISCIATNVFYRSSSGEEHSVQAVLDSIQKISREEIDLILEGLATEDDEEELFSGNSSFPEDVEVISEEEILEVLNR